MAPRKYFGKVADDMGAPVSDKPAVEFNSIVGSKVGVAMVNRVDDIAIREAAASLKALLEAAPAAGYSVSMNFTLADLGRIVISETGKVKK